MPFINRCSGGGGGIKVISETDVGDTYGARGAMSKTIYYPCCSVVNDCVYIFGGMYSSSSYKSTYCYDLLNGSLVSKKDMPLGTYGATAKTVNDLIYVIIGVNNYCYDYLTNTWTTKTGNSVALNSPCGGVVDNLIYVSSSGNNYCYDASTDTWEAKTNVPTSRSHAMAEVVNGNIYVIGGKNSSSLYNKNECYNPSTDTWETKTVIPKSMCSSSSGAVDDLIYIIGGQTAGGTSATTAFNTNYCYDYISDTWASKKDHLQIFAKGSATYNGQIFMFGVGGVGTIEAYYTPNVKEYKIEIKVGNKVVRDKTIC